MTTRNGCIFPPEIADGSVNLSGKLHEKWMEIARLCEKKEVFELTEEEKFCVCYAAGVGVDAAAQNGGKYTYALDRVNITKQNGKFIVTVI
jgi:hypothetical protein